MEDAAAPPRVINLETENVVIPSPVCWGAAEIGRVIGRTERQAFHLLQRGEIKSARKVGGKGMWFASVRALKEEFGL
jgi:hypothetical protein